MRRKQSVVLLAAGCVLAIIVGVGLGELAHKMHISYTRMVVVTHPIQAGERFSTQNLAIARVPAKDIPAGYVQPSPSILDRYAAVPLTPGSPLVESEIAKAPLGTMPATERLFMLPVSANDTVPGVTAGEHITVWSTHRKSFPVQLLTHVLVEQVHTTSSATTYTLVLTPAQVRTLVTALASNSTMYVELVPPSALATPKVGRINNG